MRQEKRSILTGLMVFLALSMLMVKHSAQWNVIPGPTLHLRRQRIIDHKAPNLNEISIHASGPFEKTLHHKDSSLKSVIITDIVFEDDRFHSDNRKSIKTCRIALLRLVEFVKRYWDRKYKIKVIKGYVNGVHRRKNAEDLLHYEGRAFDMQLIPSPRTKSVLQRSAVSRSNLQKLATLAYYGAGFSYVEVQKSYVHASCRRTSNKNPESHCFPGDAFVKTEDRTSIKMKDVKTGDKVLTMNQQGQAIYSEITMIMHRGIDALTDYIEMTTENGHKIVLSSYHLIYTNELGFIFSQDVSINQSVYTHQMLNNTFKLSRVVNKRSITKIGAYAPLTMEGTLIVNDVYTSCYAMFPSHSISHFIFSPWRRAYQYLKLMFPLPDKEVNGYHWYPNMFRTLFNLMSLYSYGM